MHEAVDLDAEVQKLDLRLTMVKLNLSDQTEVLKLCQANLVKATAPKPWVKYGYGLGLVGAFALATSAVSDYSPATRGGLGLGGLTAMSVGYWLVAP